MLSVNEEMYEWLKKLFPIARSITGDGLRETLSFLRGIIPNLEIKSVNSGQKVFDWEVPDEWSIHDAYIADLDGNKIIDFKKSNLHVVGYSIPIDQVISLHELQKNLHSLPAYPEAIPYVTSYYERNWGFCISHNQRLALKDRCYHVYINSELKPGVLNYGELIIPGDEDSEIFISTYVCHPSMANNELSGPVVATALARWIMGLDKKRFTYRFIFIPETIGSIAYLSRHLDELKKNVIAGFNLTCVGDNRTYSFMPTPWGNTLVDRVSELVLGLSGVEYTKYSVLDRGSDERQYCWPGIEIPVVSIMRSKYGTYPEYHTSMDNLDLVTPDGLGGALSLHQKCIQIIESNYIYRANCLCEPCMGKRGLYPMLSTLDQKKTSRALIDLLYFCDGKRSLLDIMELMGGSLDEMQVLVNILLEQNLIKPVGR